MKRGTDFVWSLTVLLFGFFSCAKAVTRFEDCSQARDYFVSHALEKVTGYGLNNYYFPLGGGFTVSPNASPPAPEGAVAGEDFSTTNVQESGVDEPDYVKTDGRFLYLLRETKLYIFQPTENSLKQVATLAVGEKDKIYTEMFLSGNYLLLIGRSYQSGTTTQLLLVDVSNPSQPKTVQALQMDGNLLDARLSEGVVRIVVDAGAMRFAWHTPALGLPLEDAPDSLELNRRLVENSTIANWLPYAILTNSGSGEKQTFPLTACTDIYAPDQYSGFRTITLLSIDLSKGDLSACHGATLIAEGDMIYASRENLYVATSPWYFFLPAAEENANQQNSVIHKFAFKGSASEYAASGKVPGRIRDQWSFSEYEGDLRVLSTQDIPTGDNQFTSVSQITVLRQQDIQLKSIGAIGGLGRGEFVQSVRFIGPTGYVVTFRQMDPLFVVDLSDPTQPKVTGELEITGFSAYLHPLGKNLLLGIGQDADTEGRTQGMQVSLFDVSDPTNPQRLQNITLKDAWSQVDWDHKAFLWWEPKQMLFAPFEKPDYFVFSGSPIPASGEKSEPGDAGVIAAQIKNRQLEHIATLRNAGIDEPWQKRSAKRTIIINNKVFTISSPYASNPSIGVHDLDTLQTIDRIMLKTGESE
ncbi:MAG TPA: hypothetical protein ENJ28_06110 [Gammaproteobacteria bacterium]|nr:hypothetical protein [Gammaproteobacteria bacterium]